MADPAIHTDDLSCTRGPVTALDGIDLTVPRGSVLAVLGHNGAGKTTLVQILAGLLRPQRGTAHVCGIDVVAAPAAVRRRIGVVGQQVAVDEDMTGRANLVLVARLLGASPTQARARATDLLTRYDLDEHADRPAKEWSGGLRRRLDLAAGLVGSPEVLLLDEPTTGLDPLARDALWTSVRQIVSRGTTVLLTTQYLEEADRLADHVVVLGAGRVVATGTPNELKARFAARTATVGFGSLMDRRRAFAALRTQGYTPVGCGDTAALTLPLDPVGGIPALVRDLDATGIAISALTVAEPTLDAVYLALHDRSEAQL